MMIVLACLTGLQQKVEIQDSLFHDIWFQFLMYFDIDNVKMNYASAIEKAKNMTDAEELRAAGYSEEDIAKASFNN